MFFFYCVFIILVLYSLFSKWTVSSFTKEKTSILKAILPFFIIIHHTHLFEPDFYQIGALVVSLFFFISGYGLCNKRIEGTLSIKSLPRSIFKLLFPCILPALIYYGLRILVFQDGFDACKSELLKYQILLPYTWFVATLAILYLITYLCSEIFNKNFVFFITLFVTVLLFCILGKILNIPSWARNTVTAFCAGVLYRCYEQGLVGKLHQFSKGSILLYGFLLSSLLLLSFILSVNSVTKPILSIVDRPFYAFIWSTLFFGLFVFIPSSFNSKRLKKIIDFFSIISYEMYICQSIPFLILPAFSVEFYGNKYIYAFLLLCLCVATASLCHYITSFASAQLCKKKN